MAKAKTSIWFGESGMGKTTALSHLIEHVYETTGKITRVASIEHWAPLQRLIDAGIVELIDIREFPDPLPLMRRIYLGEWPATHDKITELGASANATWITKIMRPADWSKVGLFGFEGITTFSSALLPDYVRKGRKVSQEIVGAYQEQGERFGAPAPSHYGAAQNAIIEMLVQLPKLPVDRIVWTAHEAKGEDDIYKTLVLGPGSVGKAITEKMQPLVDDLLHFWSPQKVDERRVYFERHAAGIGQDLKWPSKLGAHPTVKARLLTKWPGGYFTLKMDGEKYTEGMKDFCQEFDRLSLEVSKEAAQWKAEIDKKRNAPSSPAPAASTPPAQAAPATKK